MVSLYAWKVFLKIQRRRKARQARQTRQTELERRRSTTIGYEGMPLYYTDQLAEGQEAVFVPLERRLGEARSARMPSRRIFTRWRPNGANNAGMDSGNDGGSGDGDGDGDGSDAAIAALGAAVNPLNPLSTRPREREVCIGVVVPQMGEAKEVAASKQKTDVVPFDACDYGSARYYSQPPFSVFEEEVAVDPLRQL